MLMERDIITLRPDMKMVKASLKFSVVLIPYLIIYWLMFKGGRLFLERYTDLSYVGLYALIIVLTGVVILGVDAIISAIRPFLFDLFAQNKSDKKQVSLLTRMIVNVPLLMIPLIILVGCNIKYITSNMAFHAVDEYMTVGCLVAYLLVFSKLFYLQLVFAKRSDLITYLSLAAVIVLIISFNYFIPIYKIWGVFYATLLANVTLAILFFFAAQKVKHIEFDFKAILLNPVIVFLLVFLLERILTNSGFSYASFGFIQFILILSTILVLNLRSIKDYKTIFVKAKQKSQSEG